MKTEVIILKSHRYGYDHAVRNCGTRMIEVESAEQMEAAIGTQTAMMLFFNANEPLGQVKAQQFVEIGKKHNVPTFNDAAADVPPAENLSKYTKMGFDLVTFSGGKGLRGPQSSGLLLGRKDLIEAAMLNAPPNSDSIGRGQKVNKEEMIGLMVAVEMYLKGNHEADWTEWQRRANLIQESIGGIKSVKTEQWVGEIANHVPHLKVTWDQTVIPLSIVEVQKRLREGEPSIEVVPNNQEFMVGVWMMEPGDAEIVAKRLKQVLKAA
jgi:L-seryl-tRNA(Ser) seleniumtransferase